jgi:hypothetical protein
MDGLKQALSIDPIGRIANLFVEFEKFGVHGLENHVPLRINMRLNVLTQGVNIAGVMLIEKCLKGCHAGVSQ